MRQKRWLFCVCAAALLVAAVWQQRATEKRPALARLDAHRYLGEAIEAENLTVWPVYTDRPLVVGDFLTLHEAQSRDLAEVREIGATSAQTGDGAVVGALEIENNAALPILICAGTVVKGGKQDRQVARDFVVKARSTVPVEAFCVEQGRWSTTRAGADTKGQFRALNMVATLGVRRSGQYMKDQAKVWKEVDDVRITMSESIVPDVVVPVPEHVAPFLAGVAETGENRIQQLSVTSESTRFAPNTRGAVYFSDTVGSTSFVAAVEKHGDRSSVLGNRIGKRFLALFSAKDGPVGFAYAVNGRPSGVRTFAHSRLCKSHFDSFLQAMCIEAVVANDTKKNCLSRAAKASDVVAMVHRISAAKAVTAETQTGDVQGYREDEVGFHSYYCQGGLIANIGTGNVRLVLTEDWTARKSADATDTVGDVTAVGVIDVDPTRAPYIVGPNPQHLDREQK